VLNAGVDGVKAAAVELMRRLVRRDDVTENLILVMDVGCFFDCW